MSEPRTFERLPALAVGERYRAAVRSRRRDGRIGLQLRGIELSARSEVELRVGDEVEVEVLKLMPEVLLRVVRKLLPQH